MGLPAKLGAVFSLEPNTFFLRTTTGAWAAAELGLINRIDNRTNIFPGIDLIGRAMPVWTDWSLSLEVEVFLQISDHVMFLPAEWKRLIDTVPV